MAELTPSQRRMGMTEADLPAKSLSHAEKVQIEANRAIREGRAPNPISAPAPAPAPAPAKKTAQKLRTYSPSSYDETADRAAFEARSAEYEALRIRQDELYEKRALERRHQSALDALERRRQWLRQSRPVDRPSIGRDYGAEQEEQETYMKLREYGNE
jgi:hypothetical protein